MRVCVHIPTNKLIEMQSAATEGTLLKNAIVAGYLAAELEERVVTKAEYLALLVAPTADELAASAVDRVDRLQFDVLFNHENRMRALEAKAPITPAQFRDALIARCKVLNP